MPSRDKLCLLTYWPFSTRRILCKLLSPEALYPYSNDSTILSSMVDRESHINYICRTKSAEKTVNACTLHIVGTLKCTSDTDYSYRSVYVLYLFVTVYTTHSYCTINVICFVEFFFLSFCARDCYSIWCFWNDRVWNPYNCRWIFQCMALQTL